METVEFKINLHAEFCMKDLPKEMADEMGEMLTRIKSKKQKGKVRIDLEKVQ